MSEQVTPDQNRAGPRNILVDVECIRLAEHFMHGWKHTRDDVVELAELFQDVAEDFCNGMEEEHP